MIFQPADCSGFPIVISQAGSYVLGGDITGCSGADGIDITTSNVTLDLDGHILSGGGYSSGSYDGIKNVGGNGQLVIKNGQVQQWGLYGIYLLGSSVAEIDQMVVTYNYRYGIVIQATSAITDSTVSANGQYDGGSSSGGSKRRARTTASPDVTSITTRARGSHWCGAGNVVEDWSEVASNTSFGIEGGTIDRIVGNHLHNNSGQGISVGASAVIEDNSAEWNGGDGIECTDNCSVTGNTAAHNTGNGLNVNGGVGVVRDNVAFGNTAYVDHRAGAIE